MEFTKGGLVAVFPKGSNGFWHIKSKATNRVIVTVWGEKSTSAKLEAQELVRRWNAFEEGGLVDDLYKACEELIKSEPYGITPDFDESLRKVEAALAKVKERK